MFKKYLLKDWTHAHHPNYGQYLDYLYYTNIKSKCELGEKFGETNLKKATSENLSLRGGKQSQSAKRVKKTNKQSIGPFGEKLGTQDFVEAMVGGEEGVAEEHIVKTPMIAPPQHEPRFKLGGPSRSHS